MGIITCHTHDGGAMDSLNIILCLVCLIVKLASVSAQEVAYMIASEEVNVQRGDTAVLPCVLDPTQNAFVIWRRLDPLIDLSLGVMLDSNLDPGLKERVRIVANRQAGEYNLEIMDVRVSDESSYKCDVIFGLMTSRTVSTSVRLNVYVPPEEGFPLCDVNPAIPLKKGKVVTMSCSTRGGHPPSKVTWYRGRNPVTTAAENEQQLRWRLTDSDYGVQFTCIETHPALPGVRECSVVPLPFRLSVDLIPSIAEVDAGGETSFTCQGRGPTDAPLNFKWEVNNQGIAPRGKWAISGSNGQILSVSNVTTFDNQSSIICTVTAGPGQSVKTYAVLVVNGKPIRRTSTSSRGKSWNHPSTRHPMLRNKNDQQERSSLTTSNSISRRLVIIISFGAVMFGVLVGATVAIVSIYRSRKVAGTQSKPKSFKSSFKTGSTKSSRQIGKRNRGFNNRGSRIWRDSRRITFNDTQITFADPILDYDEPPAETTSTDPDDSYLGLCPDSLSSSKYEDLHSHVMNSLSFDRFYNEAPSVPELEYEDVIADRNWSTRSYPVNINQCDESIYLNRTSVP
nr:uncharacterized protein LOC129260506 [Lytechinus pictus]